MKISTVASSRHRRSTGDVVDCALAAHTNADQAHQMSASASIARASHPQLR
jgi:hypothetical protein